MSQTLYTFERGKADLLEGDAHGRVLKNVETFFNVIAQQQVQENSITTCAWSSLGTRYFLI